MREFPVIIEQALRQGIYPNNELFFNRPYLTDCVGLVPTEYGLEIEERYESLYSSRQLISASDESDIIAEEALDLSLNTNTRVLFEGFTCNSVCYHLGRFFIGGAEMGQIDRFLNADSVGGSESKSSVIWGRVGDDAIGLEGALKSTDAWLSNEQGFQEFEVEAEVERVVPLGDSIIIYTKRGIYQLFLAEAGIVRMRLISTMGLLSPGCVAYSRQEVIDRHVFIDTTNQLCSLVNGGSVAQFEIHGYRHYIRQTKETNFEGFYEEQLGRYLLCSGDLTLVFYDGKLWTSSASYKKRLGKIEAQFIRNRSITLPLYTNGRGEIFRISTVKLVGDSPPEEYFEDAEPFGDSYISLVGYEDNFPPVPINPQGIGNPQYAVDRATIKIDMPDVASLSSVELRIQNDQRISTRGQSAYTSNL